MKTKFLRIFAFGIGVLIFSASLAAHHGNAAYDTDKKVTVKGTVTQWIWSNPHCLLSKESLKPGDEVTVTALPLKNGKPIGRILEVLPPNGQRLAGIRIPQTSSDSPQLYPKQ